MGSVPYGAKIREKTTAVQLPLYSRHGLSAMLFWFCTTKMNSETLTAIGIKQEDIYIYFSV